MGSLLIIHGGEVLREQLCGILPQKRRNFSREQAHALACKLRRHVPEMKLDQKISDLGLFDDFPDTLADRFRASNDNGLGSIKLIPAIDVAEELATGL